MVRERFFGHVSPGGAGVLWRVGHTSYASRARLGENLAWAADDLAAPVRRSPPGCARPDTGATLAKHVRHVGVGVTPGAPADVRGAPAATYATVFGRRS